MVRSRALPLVPRLGVFVFCPSNMVLGKDHSWLPMFDAAPSMRGKLELRTLLTELEGGQSPALNTVKH